jgi:hypothetical protein
MIEFIGFTFLAIGVATIAALVVRAVLACAQSARIFAAPDDPETWP